MDPFCTARTLLASFRRIRACNVGNSMGHRDHRRLNDCRVATCCTMSRSTAAGVKLTTTCKAPTAACGMAQIRSSCALRGYTNADPTPKSLIRTSSAPGGVISTRRVSASGAAMTVAVLSEGHPTCCCLALHPRSVRHTCIHPLASRHLSISGTEGHVKLVCTKPRTHWNSLWNLSWHVEP